jgi:hypothetical protein
MSLLIPGRQRVSPRTSENKVAGPLDQLPSPDVSVRRIYAYKLRLSELEGRIKVGETARSVRSRVKEQVNTAGLNDLVEILMDEPAVTQEGRPFRDADVHDVLKDMPEVTHLAVGGVEWFQCSIHDVKTAYNSVYEGRRFDRPRYKRFGLRDEQRRAIEAADDYFNTHSDGLEGPPRFLWNAKMRFGKTFAAYHLAKRRDAKRVLVITYKPAVRASWKDDLETHTDFDGWIFFSRSSTIAPDSIAADVPLVCFASLQDLRGTTDEGAIKEHNRWIHDITWDLVIVDEYHYGAWNDATKRLLAGEVGGGEAEYLEALGEDEDPEGTGDVAKRLGVAGKAFLCLSGTPFRAIASLEFGDDQIFNWTYTDEQRTKEAFAREHPDAWNPYGALPQMQLLVYKLPEVLRRVAVDTTRDEFDLNEFFKASGSGRAAVFTHKDQVQGWLEWMRGQDVGAVVAALERGTAKPFPYADTNVLPYMNHSVWFLPSVASAFAMRNLLGEAQNLPYWGQYIVLPVAGSGPGVGVGAEALPPVLEAIGNGYDSKTITLTCGKLLTGVTIPQWSAILMLCNLEAPETYFQAAFRVQSPWSVLNPEGNDPNEERVHKPACLTIDFAPTRALRLFADYGMRLGSGIDADEDVRELSRFLPVLGFDRTEMRSIDVDEIIDIAFETSTVDTRRMDSRRFISPSVAKFEGLSDHVRRALERVTRAAQAASESSEEGVTINETVELDETTSNSDPSGDDAGTEPDDGDGLSDNDLAERLSFLAKRINAFMYLSDVIEKNLHDVLTTDELELFRTVMQLQRDEMTALVDAGLFNEQAMRLAIHQFRRADVASFSYLGLHPRTTADTGEATTPANEQGGRPIEN